MITDIQILAAAQKYPALAKDVEGTLAFARDVLALDRKGMACHG